MTYSYTHENITTIKIIKICLTPKVSSYPFVITSFRFFPLSLNLVPKGLLFWFPLICIFINSYFSDFYITETIQYVFFCLASFAHLNSESHACSKSTDHSFILLHNIALYGYTSICLFFIHLLIDICFTFYLWQIKLLKHLCTNVHMNIYFNCS